MGIDTEELTNDALDFIEEKYKYDSLVILLVEKYRGFISDQIAWDEHQDLMNAWVKPGWLEQDRPGRGE